MDLIQRYGDTESDSESDDEHDKLKEKLPVPKSVTSMFDNKLYHPKPDNDDPSSHQGRTRLFEHERGNWPTYIYIPCPNIELVEIVQEKVINCGLEIIENPHISLTRTFVLQYHWIQRFISDIKSKLTSIPRFTITFGKLEVFCNENCTRTFIGFRAQPPEMLSECVNQLDTVLSDYNLPNYYEDARFHLSVAWCLGDQSSQLKTKLKSLELEIELNTNRLLKVDKLICKTGNKIFKLNLN